MSNEIVPYMDETQTVPDSPPTTQPTRSRGCRRQRFKLGDYPDLYWDNEIKFNLISENHHLKHFFHPDKGHKYLNLFYPNPYSVRHILDTMKGPSVLYLRGCDHLLFSGDFPFAKFKTLTVLEISSIGNLTTIPEEISEMVQLQSLNFSHLPIQHFPADDFFSKLTNLKSLVLKACPNLHSLPKFPPLVALESLDLSHLLIEALPDEFFSDMKKLQRLILRGCSKLHCLPSMEPLKRLEFLDLSYTTLHCNTYTLSGYPTLTHVLCRDTKGSIYDSLLGQTAIHVLDLSGAQHVRRNIQFHHSIEFLEFVDLSRTKIESIEFPWLSFISILLLRKCSRLVKLSGMNNLSLLKVLDMSRCGSL